VASIALHRWRIYLDDLAMVFRPVQHLKFIQAAFFGRVVECHIAGFSGELEIRVVNVAHLLALIQK